MKRRKFVQRSIFCTSLGYLSGCSLLRSGTTQEPAATNSSSVPINGSATSGGPTPEYSLPLEINNVSSEPINITIRLVSVQQSQTNSTTVANSVIYSDTLTLEPSEKIDLKPYRNSQSFRMVLESNDEVVFEEFVELQEGFKISFLSETQISAETVVA